MQIVQIGSFSARAFFDSPVDAALLNQVFKTSVRDLSDPAAVDAELHWTHANAAVQRRATPLPDTLTVTREHADMWRVESEFLAVSLERCAPPTQIFVTTYPHALDPLAWRVHVSVVFHKLLLLLGRLYLHAGAVRTGDTASAFMGDKGSGKSTLCLRLGQAGATILSDDHISIRQCAGIFYASGCEQVARVTAVTEAALFSHPMNLAAYDFGGVLKKEFALSEWFPALPYQDVPLQRIFFPHIGAQWQLRALSSHALLKRLLEMTRSAHRFADKQDYARHLDYFSALAQSVEAFDLELSPNLQDLDRLVTFLDV